MYELIESMATPIMWVLVLLVLGLILRLRPQKKRLCFFGQFLIIAAGLIYISLAHLSSPTDFYILWKANIPAPMLRIFQIWI